MIFSGMTKKIEYEQPMRQLDNSEIYDFSSDDDLFVNESRSLRQKVTPPKAKNVNHQGSLLNSSMVRVTVQIMYWY